MEDSVGGIDDIERRARAAEHRLCFVFARHFGWEPDAVLGLAWDTIDAFQDEFAGERDDDLARQPDDVTPLQPLPENPDPAFWARQRALQAVLERASRDN